MGHHYKYKLNIAKERVWRNPGSFYGLKLTEIYCKIGTIKVVINL